MAWRHQLACNCITVSKSLNTLVQPTLEESCILKLGPTSDYELCLNNFDADINFGLLRTAILTEICKGFILLLKMLYLMECNPRM
jgi:hypothetical protein